MDGFCRGCLVHFDEPTDLFQYSEKNRRLFVYSTGLQVKRNDSFTFQLCKECYHSMKNACSFKKVCRHSDKLLKNYYACKDTGDTADFGTFLKNNDETIKFRLPMLNGNSTPANNKRDEDNESTCTSIQNFMTDILKAEEIPDNEARIIREVIEEEADVLDDSLDSHWLQEDASVDTDFRLDFSLSPFSTPRSDNGNNGQYISPQKIEESISQDKIKNFKSVHTAPETDIQISKTIIDSSINSEKCTIDSNLEYALRNTSAQKVSLDELLATPPVLPDISAPSTPVISNILFGKKIDEVQPYANYDNKDGIIFEEQIDDDEQDSKEGLLFGNNIEDNYHYDKDDILFGKKIDDNHLDEKDDVLLEQKIYVNGNCDQNDTLFEKKIDDNDLSDKDNIYFKKIDNEHVIKDDIDVIDEFLKDDNLDLNVKENYDISIDQELIDYTQDLITPKKAIEDQYCIINYYCKMCNRQFCNLKALKIHYTKQHKSKIQHCLPRRATTKFICDYCGRVFVTPTSLKKHISMHMNPKIYVCKHCTLKFGSEKGLKFHLLTHNAEKVNEVEETKTKKKYVCSICGKACSSSSNYHVHMRRHDCQYTSSCKVCGKGFYRTCDLATHMRGHTGEKPYECIHCPRRFARSDVLNRHIKIHTEERLYICQFCTRNFAKASEVKVHQIKSKRCLKLQLLIAFS